MTAIETCNAKQLRAVARYLGITIADINVLRGKLYNRVSFVQFANDTTVIRTK